MANITVIIKRFFEGSTSVVGTPSGDPNADVRGKDFMRQDLTVPTRY